MVDSAETAPGPGAPLTVREWSEAEFAASKAAWDELLAASDADPLFMSWDWQWRWWQHHAKLLEATLKLVAVYVEDRVVGLAPLYLHRAVVRHLLPVRRIELIGTAWRSSRATFSDYLDIVAARDYRNAVARLVGDWLRSQSFWDELLICCTRRDGVASAMMRGLAQFVYVREVDELRAWRAELPASFEEYLASLSSDVRRRLYHQRRKLDNARVHYAVESEVPELLRELEHYSSRRWGVSGNLSQAGNATSRQFLADFALCMVEAGKLRLSRLTTSGGGTVSVMYNVKVGDTVYFLQSGIDTARTRGISPGLLHFGYAIEAACKERATRFDFLAGPGRHRDYKRDLGAEPVEVVTYHMVRSRWFATLYAAYEMLKKCRIGFSLVRCSRVRRDRLIGGARAPSPHREQGG